MKQYKGDLVDFPIEVVEKMLDYQEEQGNPRDVNVFEKEATAGAYEKGFVWENTEWGSSFWYNIINGKNFDLFFQKYPRKLIFEKNTAYQASNKEEAEMLLKEAHRQGKKWNSGRSYLEYPNNWENSKTCYCILEGYWARKEYWIEEEGYKIITVKEFFNLTNKTMNNNRFPFGLYTADAQRIIDIACGSWKVTLAGKWSKEIVLKKLIQVDEDFYKEMRKACTKEQNLLFDEIFGVDKVEIDFTILNDEDVFYLVTDKENDYLFKGSKPFTSKVPGINSPKKDLFRRLFINYVCHKSEVSQLRKATQQEQDLYYKHYPKWSLKDAKDGEPVWVSDYGSVWQLRYCNGEGSVYCDQRKKGSSVVEDIYNFSKKFDPNNLPVNN